MPIRTTGDLMSGTALVARLGDQALAGPLGRVDASLKRVFNQRRLKKTRPWLSAEETAGVARDLGVSVAEVTEMEKRLAARDLSFDPAPDAEDEEAYSPAAYLPSPDADPAGQVEEAESADDSTDRLHGALSRLDERSRDIVDRKSVV